MSEHYDIEMLLRLDGRTFVHPDGRHWVKFEAHRVEITKEIPHGIKYSLTVHDFKDNKRVIGYDNAHAMPKSKKYVAKKTTWDHRHMKHKIAPYEFESAAQLIEDFWATFDEYFGKERRA